MAINEKSCINIQPDHNISSEINQQAHPQIYQKKPQYSLPYQPRLLPYHPSSRTYSLTPLIYDKHLFLCLQMETLELQQLIRQSILSKMGILSRLKKLIEITDFFNSTQMLRYEKQNEYRTFTGGIISLGIIVTIVIGFASMILDTLTLSSISYTENIATLSDPSSTTIVTSPDNNFMFAIEIWRQNLSAPVRYFDVIAQLDIEHAGQSTLMNLSLEQCTREHWASMPSLLTNFDALQVSGWLCPPIGAQFQLRGKYTSDLYKYIIFTVSTCNNDTDPSRPCASQSEIDQLFADNGDWFYFTFYYINTILNPGQSQYKSYYLQDTAYVIFSKQLGAEAFLYFSDYEIDTDYSIWPFPDIVSEMGFLTQNPGVNRPYPITSGNNANYLTYCVAKSPKSILYSRQVQKISNVFSFMGGLIGALMAGLFIVNAYTSFAFEISIAMAVFKKEKAEKRGGQGEGQGEEDKSWKIINIMHFVRYYWYRLRKKLNSSYSDDHQEHIFECRKEIISQLDIKSLIRRIIFLEYAMTFIFSDYQLEGLQVHKPTNPLQVKAVRKRIENIDRADLNSELTLSDIQKGKQTPIDQLEFSASTFNLGVFLTSKKVANLHNQAQQNTPQLTTAKRDELALQNISEISIQESLNHHLASHGVRQVKKRSRLQDLQLSAKQGNEISQRIWNSLHKIDPL